MKTEHMNSKFNTQRPGSSARVYDYVNSNNGAFENSKIPKYPKRTCSLENRGSQEHRSFSRAKVSTTSMIPRLEIKRCVKNNSSWNKNKKRQHSNIPLLSFPREKLGEQINSPRKEQCILKEITDTTTILHGCTPPNTVPSLECKVNKDFINFKNNVLKIPEYWTDAGKTAATILKNAVEIVKKQYPNMEKESFEAEIESILKATDAVKQQILTKTENIINKATQIYAEGNEVEWNPNEDDDIEKITKKMEELKDEVRVKKYVFGDLLKCSNEVKQLLELEKVLKQKMEARKNLKAEVTEAPQKKTGKEGQVKCVEGKKSKKLDHLAEYKKREKSMLNSCGDVLRQNSSFFKEKRDKSLEYKKRIEKTTQTVISWTDELLKHESSLSELNQKIVELQDLCKDHISKFKSFNLQIKLRGICNKAQRTSVTKELEILNDEKMQLEEKNSQLLCYNKDLESAIKKKDLDLHQKDKLIIQQKKLLHVRDELIEMLKNRCNLEERQRY